MKIHVAVRYFDNVFASDPPYRVFPGVDICLDAFEVALEQAGGRTWYVGTLELLELQ